eukprot:g59175.t1
MLYLMLLYSENRLCMHILIVSFFSKFHHLTNQTISSKNVLVAGFVGRGGLASLMEWGKISIFLTNIYFSLVLANTPAKICWQATTCQGLNLSLCPDYLLKTDGECHSIWAGDTYPSLFYYSIDCAKKKRKDKKAGVWAAQWSRSCSFVRAPVATSDCLLATDLMESVPSTPDFALFVNCHDCVPSVSQRC